MFMHKTNLVIEEFNAKDAEYEGYLEDSEIRVWGEVNLRSGRVLNCFILDSKNAKIELTSINTLPAENFVQSLDSFKYAEIEQKGYWDDAIMDDDGR